jgi:hypothetical protein
MKGTTIKLRERDCTVVCGTPGRGKTWFAFKLIKTRKEKHVIAYVEEPHIDEFSNEFYRIHKLSEYKGGWAKIGSLDMKYEDFLKQMLLQFRNGCILVDEAELHEKWQLTYEMQCIIAQRRRGKLNTDIILLYHDLAQVPIESQSYIQTLVLFYTAGNIDYKKNKIARFGEIKAAKDRVERIALHAKPGSKEYHYCEVVKMS